MPPPPPPPPTKSGAGGFKNKVFLVLKRVKRVNEKISYITFDKPITGKVELFDGVENISWHASAIIEKNVVRNNRARSFLISTPRKVVVRNNHLSSQMAAFRITGDLNLWNESGPNADLLIENNVIENSVYGGAGVQAVFLIDPEYPDKKNIEGKYSKNITIRNNVIKTFDSSILVDTNWTFDLVFKQTENKETLCITAPTCKWRFSG